MLIKDYISHGDKPGGHLHIYDNVSDVVIHEGIFDGRTATGPDIPHPAPTHHITVDSQNVKFVDFTQHSVRTRLAVATRAYVCNDEGRTIEKVSAA